MLTAFARQITKHQCMFSHSPTSCEGQVNAVFPPHSKAKRRPVEVAAGEILMMAIHDSDQWVSMVAEILRTFPATGALNLELEDNNGTFAEVLADLKKLVKKTVDVRMLPMECQFLNKTALIAATGQQPQPVKHFALKRKPKSATLRAELLNKSSEVAQNKKKNGSDYLPIKVRSFAKKMDDNTPLKGFSAKNSSSGGFLSPSMGGRRTNLLGSTGTPLGGTPNRMGSLKKEGGIKLLDITEQPVGLKEAKRRKKIADMEAMEQQKKEREAEKAAAAAAASATSAAPYTPDYAAGLVSPAPTKLSTAIIVGSAPAAISQPVTYVPSSSARLPTPNTTSNSTAATQQARDNLQQQLKQQLGQSQIRTQTTTVTIQPNNQSQIQAQVSTSAGTLPVSTAGIQSVPTPPAPQTTQTAANPAAVKKGLSLTREQMLEAQEMFRVSNKVTRPEKALILGFMAGSRDNPCPQQGNILSIRLSETRETVTQPDKTSKIMLVDTFFQMNYLTGHWKRVKTFREVEDTGT